MNFSALLLADALGTIIQIAGLLLFVLVPLLIKWLSGAGDNQAQPRPGQRPVVRPGQQPGQRPGQAPGQRPGGGAARNEPLRNEVEEFLRRAQRQQQGQPQAPPAQARPIRPPQPRPVRQAEIIEAEVLETPVRAPLAPPPRAPEFAQQIGQADEQLEAHLRDTFSHELSHFKSTDTASPGISQGTDADVWKTVDPDQAPQPAGPSLADEIAAMFRDSRSVRKAVVLTEILNPPEHRWS